MVGAGQQIGVVWVAIGNRLPQEVYDPGVANYPRVGLAVSKGS